ncbi:MAG: hypothetical protein IPL49_20930 [Saprospirales bacterium]|nr:hypothetical protein [Saprospirales bacterium]MBK8493274.1 hypothetical protein [Saprospirales bacterium]
MERTIVFLLCLAGWQVAAQPLFFSVGKNDSDGYYATVPQDTTKGLLLVIPRPGQAPESVFRDSVFSALANEAGFVLLAPPHPEALLLTPAFFRYLNVILQDAAHRFGVAADRIAIGGIKEGGILALQFTEECWAAPQFYPYHPKAVFAINAPVELVAWWESAERDLNRNSSPEAIAEATVILDRITRELGGAPDSLLTTFASRSPFFMGNAQVGKEQFLLPVSLRLYYPDDFQAQLRDHHRDLYDLPVGPASALLNRLLRQGHPHADMQLYIPDPSRPFMLSDPEGCIQWLVESLWGKSEKE